MSKQQIQRAFEGLGREDMSTFTQQIVVAGHYAIIGEAALSEMMAGALAGALETLGLVIERDLDADELARFEHAARDEP